MRRWEVCGHLRLVQTCLPVSLQPSKMRRRVLPILPVHVSSGQQYLSITETIQMLYWSLRHRREQLPNL